MFLCLYTLRVRASCIAHETMPTHEGNRGTNRHCVPVPEATFKHTLSGAGTGAPRVGLSCP